MCPANDAKILDVKWTGISLLTFKKPDKHAITRLGALMAGMTVTPVHGNLQSPHKPCDATNSGSLETILGELKCVLKKDYQNTLEDVKEWSGDFDYVVTNSSAHPGSLHILTRLSHPEKGGNIFYGRTVQRVSVDTYLMWIDD